ncbi:ABC transporter substrate-binding protein [Paraburkholderia sp. EG285A]|uniref:ABC transporter substrate-binding protein n=1 Tax=Paraburkholderia sp. EG285A TaxID=3237009 RepID=UPI0034D2126C
MYRIKLSAAISSALLSLALLHSGMARASDDSEVKIAYVTGDLSALVPLVADSQGIFQKHQLKASFIAVKSGPEMVSAIISGSAEFSDAAPQIAFPAMARGAHVVYLMNNYDLDYSLLARPSVAINDKAPYPDIVKPLKGMRVGVVGRGGLTEIFARKVFADAGLNPDKDMSIIAVGAGLSAVGAFQNDQVDALVSLPPTDTVLGRGKYEVVVSNKTARDDVFGKNFISTGVSANGDFVDANPQVTQRYCEAYKETIDFIHAPQNREAVVKLVSAKLNLPVATAGRVFDQYSANFNARLTKERWDFMRKRQPDAPTWEKGVYPPCAEISVK